MPHARAAAGKNISVAAAYLEMLYQKHVIITAKVLNCLNLLPIRAD